MISRKQILALQLVYTRRIDTVKRAMIESMAQLNEAREIVRKHEHTINVLQGEIETNSSVDLPQLIADVVQRERLLYWLNYDLEDIQYRLGNARESLNEKQAEYDQCKQVYLRTRQRLDFVDAERRNLLKAVALKQEQIDDELFSDTVTGQIHA